MPAHEGREFPYLIRLVLLDCNEKSDFSKQTPQCIFKHMNNTVF